MNIGEPNPYVLVSTARAKIHQANPARAVDMTQAGY